MTNGNRRLFGTDGIRGQANCYPITPEIALQLGKSIAHVFRSIGSGSMKTLIGKDTRLSGYMLETALTSGLVSMGMDVFLVGPMPTPSVAHLTRSMNATVGIMLTASHNPFDDNGIKVFDEQGFKLSDGIESEIEKHVLSGNLASDHVRSAHLGRAYRIDDARGRYIEYAKNTIQNQSLEGLRIVLDCANGAAYQIGPWIFKELGVEVIKTGVSPDGLNINLDCGALHPEAVGKLVEEHSADAGIAFDGDADRVVFCDSEGKAVDGDQLVAMCAIDLKKRGLLTRDSVVVTSVSNLGMHKALKNHGIEVLTTDVGDRYVIERMREGGFKLGGEKSGHIIFMDHATTGDGIISALQVLRLLKDSGSSLAELADCFDEYPQQIRNIQVTRKPPLQEVPGLTEQIQECEAELKGLGRVLVRYSGTERMLRILVEGRDERLVEKWAESLSHLVRSELGN